MKYFIRINVLFFTFLFLAGCSKDYSDGRYHVYNEEHSLYSYLDEDGKEQVTQIKFSEGLAAVKLQPSGEYAYINTKGEISLKPNIKDGYFINFSEGLAGFSVDYKTGYINKNGEVVLPLNYEGGYPNSFENGVAVVRSSYDKYAVIDKEGEFIAQHINYAVIYSEGLMRAVDAGESLFSYLNVEGETVIDAQFQEAGNFHEGLAEVSFDGELSGYINKEGKIIVEPKYEGTGYFSEGLAYVKKDGLYGYINKDGEEVTPFKFDYAHHFENGIAIAEVNNKWGIINKSAQWIIEPTFDRIGPFTQGLGRITVNGRYGFINEKGEVVIQPKYTEAEQFIKGVSYVKSADFVGYINKTGDVVYKQ